jgi:hypothetical protein
MATDAETRKSIGKQLGILAALVSSYCLLTVLMWPFLWADPIGHFTETLTGMGQYIWQGSELFMGHDQDVTQLPWYYVPVWVGITMPPLIVGAFLLGNGSVAMAAVRNRLRLFKGPGQRFDLACLMLFWAGPIAAMVLGSVLYNGWRQMFFIGGPMVMLALLGLHQLASALSTGWKRWVVPTLAMAQVVACAGYLVIAHPHQYVYFNLFAGPEPSRFFEMDYWGQSYRDALEYVAENDPSDSLTVRSWNYTGYMDRSFLSPEDKARVHVHFTDSLLQGRLPDYQITSKRSEVEKNHGFELVHEVKSGRQTVNWVYKRSVPQNPSDSLASEAAGLPN